MKYVKSCGAVVFTRKNDQINYVIIRALNGEFGFPKGHMELDEDEQTTALREISEEVGLHPSFVNGFRQEKQYLFPNKPGVAKIAVYFLAEYSNQVITIQPEEVSCAYLLSYDDAYRILSFPETKSVLEQAHCFLTNTFP